MKTGAPARLDIPEGEYTLSFVRSPGPGGQNVNKVATGVQLRFDVARSPSLPDDVRRRLLHIGGSRITAEGVLLIDAQRFRSQESNRRDALDRLIELICKAAEKPKVRHRTRPSRAARARRLDVKRRRGGLKRLRRDVPSE